jgi:hypothetical protein
MVTGQDVARLIGHPDNTKLIEVADEAVEVVTEYVRAYTRDEGFDHDGYPLAPVASVIKSASVRMAVNPQYVKRQSAGSQSVTPSILDGFTLPELAVLNRYRRRAK